MEEGEEKGRGGMEEVGDMLEGEVGEREGGRELEVGNGGNGEDGRGK